MSDTAALFLITVGLYTVLFGGVGMAITFYTGREPAEGLFLGVLLGPLGCIIAALLPSRPAPGSSPAAPVAATIAPAPVVVVPTHTEADAAAFLASMEPKREPKPLPVPEYVHVPRKLISDSPRRPVAELPEPTKNGARYR